MNKRILMAAWIAVAAGVFPVLAQDTFNGHKLRLNAAGKLEPWTEPGNNAYSQILTASWDFLLNKVPKDPKTGLPVYLAYCCLDVEKGAGTAWPHNPAGLYAMFADSAAAWYAYSGDARVIDFERRMLDYQLAHGTTPANWLWGGVPYASSDHGSPEYRGAYEFQYDDKQPGRGDGYGVIEPDKVGELGFGYLKFYELTGDIRYRDAAISCAGALARNIRPGDEKKSPWPFRVYAELGRVREEYTANVIGAIALFDELVRLRMGETSKYEPARAIAWKWLMDVPVRNNVWTGYFEDIPIARDLSNLNQYSPLETARYLLEHPETDPEWRAHVAGLIDFVEQTFGVDKDNGKVKFPGMQFGARTISEQLGYVPKMGSHTSRYASVLARWAAVIGDAAKADEAYRSLNWATYMCKPGGACYDAPDTEQGGLWFSDGYGDFIRHFLYAMGAQPQWAPEGENHILRSTSVVKKVEYAADRVSYSTFEKSGTEVLRLRFVPRSVAEGASKLDKLDSVDRPGWTFDPVKKVLTVRHAGSGDITVR
jgi:hypothetical protein